MNEYPAAFQRAIAFVLPHEEVFVRGHWGDEHYVIPENVPGDDGGLTKYGIDQRSHPTIDIASLTRDQAIDIYYHDYWLPHHLDALPDLLAIAMFDVWVNGGHAVEWLQRAINEVSNKKLVVDGVLGPATLSAAHDCDQKAVMLNFLKQRDERFDLLARLYRNDGQFLAGWKQRNEDLRQALS